MASKEPAGQNAASSEANRITGLSVAEEAGGTAIFIRADRPLAYTSVKQPFPMSVILYFPDTTLGNVAPEQPVENQTIGSLKATELTEKGSTVRIEIGLKKDMPYEVSREESGLKVSFPVPVTTAGPQSDEPSADAGEQKASRASAIHAIEAAPMEAGVRIYLVADGAIEDFRSFTVENPPRIVFDIPGLRSSLKKGAAIPVNTSYVSQVRHFGYPDRVRVVLDTKNEFLSTFSANPGDNGLVIEVGPHLAGAGAKDPGKPAGFTETPNEPTAEISEKKPKALPRGPAVVNRIDFSSEAAGKSTVIIGTTAPVEYSVKKAGDKRLHLELYRTRIPDYHQRPLITTRFESAVDRVVPSQKADADPSLVAIDLRESVPYFVEQTDGALMIHFEASSVPPRPFGEAGLADRRKAVAAGAGPSGAKAAPAKMEKAEPDAPQKVEERATPWEPAKVFTGEKIALDFYETDIKNVFRIFKEVSGKNFAVDNDVTGKATLTLDQPVPWDQVFDLILRMNQLGSVMEGNIIRVATLATLGKEDEQRQKMLTSEKKVQEQKVALEPLITEYLPINYSSAKTDILPHLEKVISKERGSLTVDERTNVVILTDTADKIRQAKEIVEELDKVTPQVIIEARIVEANTNFTKEIGTQWGTGIGVQSPGVLDSRTVGQALTPNVTADLTNRVGSGPERGFNNLGGTYGLNMAMNFPTASDAASFGFNFVRIAGTPFLLNAKIMALESRGDARLVSAPKIVTLDNKKAVIKQGLRYPYLKLDEAGNTTIEFEDIDLVLEVTPHVTLDQRISMNLNITKKDLGSIINNQQSFTTKEAQTELLVNDGDTVVIGGIIKTTKRSGQTGLPFLSDIPILGWFFKTQSKDDSKEELLIFITPRIVQLEKRAVS
jgi:type IV pilus assembly protein PilQ